MSRVLVNESWGRCRKARAQLALRFMLLTLVGLIVFTGNDRSTAVNASDPNAPPSNYWRFPLAPQGQAPMQWSEVERSLAPEACGQCHIDKFEEWRGSIHAKALSPGLVGQLLTFDSDQTASCMECHAPLAEQRQAFEAARARDAAHLPAEQGLAAVGNSCSGCHLRGHRRYGPPSRATGATGQSQEASAHSGVRRTAYFEDSEFCSGCHQFSQEYAINGKPLQNTLVEWRASPQAVQGITCQGCHMPDRRHLWRGIHDQDMVVAGLAAAITASSEGARFLLTNSGVGHAFPTYVTPRVEMHAVALDENGKEVPDTAVLHVIQRVVAWTDEGWVELSDTRLLPGEKALLTLPWQRFAKARVWLEVKPDDYYDNQVYDALLDNLPAGSHAAHLIARADNTARASSYRLFVTDVEKP